MIFYYFDLPEGSFNMGLVATNKGVWAPRSADFVNIHNKGFAIKFPTI